MPSTRVVIGVAVSSLLIAGCGTAEDQAQADGQGQHEENGDRLDVSVSETFAPYADGVNAVTHDEEAVPEGATVEVTVTEKDGGSAYSLTVAGLEADREFGAHLHTRACGENPDDSGPHYQDEVDPEADSENPSTNPEFANPENEVWLDFVTDDEGDAEQETEVSWLPREGEANSIVIHEEHTRHHEGEAGQAGDRLACVNVPL